MRRTLSIGLIVGLGAFGSQPLAADTPVGGLICTDTTWTLAGSPYIVTTAILIGCDATLTIEPGVVVEFDDGLGLTVGSNAFDAGTLVARGTQESEIRFTSSTGTGPNRWARIYFTDYAVDAVYDTEEYLSGSVLEYVIVEYAGSGDVPAVTAEFSSPWLSHCDIHENSKRGIYVDGNNTEPIRIESCNVSVNDDGGIHIYRGSGHQLTGNTITGNIAPAGGGGIYFHLSSNNVLTANTISGNSAQSWYGGGIQFRSSEDSTLRANTISGNTASAGGGLYFGPTSGGNTLEGNTISSNTASSNVGGGIYFGSDSGNNELTGESITDNTASGEGAAICFDGTDYCTLTQCVVARNRVADSATTGGIFVTRDARHILLAGDPDGEVYNVLALNDGCQVRNDNIFYADGRNDIDATYVFWGTCDPEEIQAGICDYFDNATKAIVLFDPFVESTLGDLDLDGDVDQSDLGILLADWGCTGGDCVGDCDFDGDTDQADLGILLAHWGEDCN